MRRTAARAGVGIGVIGCGYWGPNLVRNYSRHEQAKVVALCDQQTERADQLADWYGVDFVTSDADELISHPDVQLVIVATPSRTHYALAKRAILAGKHVLVTKPMTTLVEHAEELVALAQRHGVLLAVDHTFVYTGAVRMMRDLITSGELGEIYYVDSVRINLGVFQSDVSVLWDLAPHDVSIIDYLLGGMPPTDVSAVGATHAGGRVENMAYLTMRYPSNVLAHVHVNWLAPAKIRRTIVGGSKRMLVYDDMQPSEKLLIYDKGVVISPWAEREEVYEQMVAYRAGDMSAPRLDDREALAVETDEIVDCVLTGSSPVADGESGLRTVTILAAAEESIRQDSHPVTISATTGPSLPIPISAEEPAQLEAELA